MATGWLTYAWGDNEEQDVDYLAQELIDFGVSVKLDRWNIGAGKRLWEQIEQFIANPRECDGWLMYVTQKSLGSEACREEYAYALDRALKQRGSTFPIIGIFPSSIDDALIPAGLRTRLYVSTRDPDWKERVRAAVECRNPEIARSAVPPYFVKLIPYHGYFIIEVRPRAGTWNPFFCGTPLSEKVGGGFYPGPAGGRHIPAGGVFSFPWEYEDVDQDLSLSGANLEITSTTSAYISCRTIPSFIVFGVTDGQPQYRVERDELIRSLRSEIG